MSRRKQRLLYVCADPAAGRCAPAHLTELDLDVETEPNVDAARERLSDGTCDFLVVDCLASECREFAGSVAAENPTLPVLCLVAGGAERDVIEFMDRGIVGYLIKDDTDRYVASVGPMLAHLSNRAARRIRQIDSDRERHERHRHASRFNDALADLIRSKELKEGDYQGFVRRVTQLMSSALMAQRVSVWRMAPEIPAIQCLDLWDAMDGVHTQGAELRQSEYPSYFRALMSKRVLVFNDVMDAEETSELAADYLPAHKVSSMLDTPLLKAGDVTGVMCLEHTGPARTWSLEEQAFCISVSDLISMVGEIHARLTAERDLEISSTALMESEVRYKRAAQIANLGYWVWDQKADRMAFATEELAKVYGTSVENYIRRSSSVESDLGWYHPDDRAEYEKLIRTAARNKTGYDTVVRIVRDDGSIRYLHEVTEVVLDSNGGLSETVGILRDITEEKKLEFEREAARFEAERANKAKSEFLAAMSHEFRTPLNAIIGFSEVIRDQVFGPMGPDRYVSYIHDILGSGHHMLALVNEVLEVSTIEAGRRPIEPVPVDIRDLLSSCLRALEAKAASKEVKLAADIDVSIEKVWADPTAIRQIVFNLIDNAIKFNRPDGTVTVTVRPSGENVQICFIDTGIGVPEHRVKDILQPFTQMDPDPTRSKDGVGLGLAIAKALIEKHDGALTLESPPAGGTVVTVRLPVGPTP